MATNKATERSHRHTIAVPSGVTSGAPLIIGNGLSCTAITNRDADGKATVEFPFAIALFDFSVKGVDDNGNVAIALHGPVYYTSGDTPTLNGKSSGEFYGFAMEVVASSATTVIKVLMAHHQKGRLKFALVAGSTAGTHTVTGIATGDELIWVGHFTTAAAIATLADLTSEFSITGADEVTNTTADTTNDQLMVVWLDRT